MKDSQLQTHKRTLNREALFFLLLLTTTFAVYFKALSFGFLTTWDDPAYIVNNASAHGFSAENIKTAFSRFYVGNYAPLQIISYMLDYTFWGLNALGYTLHNIVLHTLNGFLLYLILRRLELSASAALMAALLFLIHPVQVESVVWLSQRKNVLAMFFFLLALRSFIIYREKGSANVTDYFLALTFFTASILTKSVAVVFPLLMVLYDLIVVRRRISSVVTAAMPFALFAFAVAYMTMLSQSEEYGGGGRTYFHGGGKLATFITMLPVFATYVRMVFAPYGLSVVYAPQIRYVPDGVVLFSALLLLLLAFTGYMLWKRARLCFFWYISIPVAILPVSQLVPLVTMMNDRYLYFPMVGIAALFGFGIAALEKRAKAGQLVVIIVAVVIAVFGVISYKRIEVWRSPLSLWQDAVAKQPKSAVALIALGGTQADAGDNNNALKNLERAKELCTGVECYHVNEKLYSLYLNGGRRDLAEKCADELIQKFPKNANGYLVKGYLKYNNNEMEQAEKLFVKGISIDPNQPASLHVLGKIYMAAGNLTLAKEKMIAAHKLGNPSAELNYSLACLESKVGDIGSGLYYLESALKLGYNRLDLIMSSPELASLRAVPEFRRLLSLYFPNIQKKN